MEAPATKRQRAVRRRRSGGGGGRCRARCWPADIRRWLAGFCCVTAAFSLSAVMLGRRKLLLVVMLLLTLHLQTPVAGQAHAGKKFKTK